MTIADKCALELRDYNGRRVKTVGESVEELDEVTDGGEQVLSCTIVPACLPRVS
jgi:hypothetical protein